MQLLVCVINDPAKVDEILEAFIEIGITGATIIDTYGMGRTLVQDVPIFAGFRNLLSGTSKYNKTIFSVIDEDDKVNQATAAIETIVGELETPSSGIVFTIPVNFVKGLKPEL
jgi:nitrogen regulatory protein PII